MVGGIAGQVAGTVRRRQQDREPRVLLYDAHGLPSLLPPGAPGRDAIVATAGMLVELADKRLPAPAVDPETGGDLEPGADADPPPASGDATGPAA
jgi:hypothetical protein